MNNSQVTNNSEATAEVLAPSNFNFLNLFCRLRMVTGLVSEKHKVEESLAEMLDKGPAVINLLVENAILEDSAAGLEWF
eukprot:gene13786-562_t